jgi:hypothetical protein
LPFKNLVDEKLILLSILDVIIGGCFLGFDFGLIKLVNLLSVFDSDC